MTRQVAHFSLEGGENLVTPALAIPPGECLLLYNYEPYWLGGYRRVDGFERYDGRPSPTDSTYSVLNFNASGTTAIAVDDIVTGLTTGDTGRVTSVNITSGSWAGADAAGFLILANPSGVFQDLEDLQVSAVTLATANGTTTSASNDTDNATYTQEVIEALRTDIQTVPGSGSILGVWLYAGTLYAFRDNAGGTACVMHKATANGWVTVTTPTLLPGGRYDFVNANFTGHTSTVKMYGADGTNKGFEFDGTTFTQITTGMVTDTPTHVFSHRNHLFFSFTGGSIQHSSIGEPTVWSPITGAAELALGDECTGFNHLPGDILAIWTRNATHVLYGTSSADWELRTHSWETGAIEWSIQSMGRPRYMDDHGLTSLNATQAFGDFVDSTFSSKIQPLIDENKDFVASSIRVRKKNLYRVFFTDGVTNNLGIVCLFKKGKFSGSSRIDYGKPVRVTCSGEDANGSELLFFGSDDGYVYQMDKGTSFDGQPVVAAVRFPFNHLRQPERKKRFFEIKMELDAPSRINIEFTPDFSYGSEQFASPRTQTIDVASGGGFWDQAVWDQFVWSEAVVGQAEAYIEGSGTNIGVYLRTEDTYAQPHTIQSMLLHYAVRGLKR